MILYLHIGTEKTGSSFLQTLIYYNREYLSKVNNMYVPENLEQDRRMEKGIISGGNGFGLFKILESCSIKELHYFLKEIKTKALKNNCNKILLSNENLFRVLGKRQIDFFQILKELKIEIKLCLYVRNPIDHILSMYKHRNKFGKYNSINDWLINYTTLQDLDHFLEVVESKNLKKKLIVFSYDSPKPLEKSFFDDFLNVNSSNLKKKFKQVNSSLTLSEIGVLKCFYVQNKFLSEQISQELEKLDKNLKAKDNGLIKDFHEYNATIYVLENFDYINNIYNKINLEIFSNSELSEKLKNQKDKFSYNFRYDLSLSYQQLELIASSCIYNNIIRLKFVYFRRKFLAPLLPKKIMKFIKYYRI